jgi:hypothetical protein
MDVFGNVQSRYLVLDQVEVMQETNRCLDENLEWLGLSREDIAGEPRAIDVGNNAVRVEVGLVAWRFLPPRGMH